MTGSVLGLDLVGLGGESHVDHALVGVALVDAAAGVLDSAGAVVGPAAQLDRVRAVEGAAEGQDAVSAVSAVVGAGEDVAGRELADDADAHELAAQLCRVGAGVQQVLGRVGDVLAHGDGAVVAGVPEGGSGVGARYPRALGVLDPLLEAGVGEGEDILGGERQHLGIDEAVSHGAVLVGGARKESGQPGGVFLSGAGEDTGHFLPVAFAGAAVLEAGVGVLFLHQRAAQGGGVAAELALLDVEGLHGIVADIDFPCQQAGTALAVDGAEVDGVLAVGELVEHGALEGHQGVGLLQVGLVGGLPLDAGGTQGGGGLVGDVEQVECLRRKAQLRGRGGAHLYR